MTNYLSSIKGFHHSFKIQLRVIYALLMREIITRYGRHNIGFAWLFVEPMIFTSVIALFWNATRDMHQSGALPIVPFAVIGYSIVLCWRNSVGRVTKAISANTGLLYHRNVTVIDVYLARIFLEVFGSLVSFLVLSAVFYFFDLMPLPDDFLYMVFGGLLLIWFTVGFSFVMGCLCEMSEVFNRFWGATTIIIFPISGVAFFVHWLPNIVREYILYIPMVHFTEMIRHGYYGDVIPTYENIGYIVECNLMLSFVGLTLLRYVEDNLE